MAAQIKRIERDFLLKALYDEQIPVMYPRGGADYVLKLESPAKRLLSFKADRPVPGLKAPDRLELVFDYRGKVVRFSAAVVSCSGGRITACGPELAYQDALPLTRALSPPGVEARFTFRGDRYSLSYPRITRCTPDEINGFVRNLDPDNFQELTAQMALWLTSYCDHHRLTLFRTTPAALEDRILAASGKTLFLPSTEEGRGFLETDPHPQKRILTAEEAGRLLKHLAPGAGNPAAYIKSRRESGVLSEAWVPLLFQEYVIGSVRIWNDTEIRALTFSALDIVRQFAQVLAYSLKINGCFEKGRLPGEPFHGRIIDLSAAGLLFAYPRTPVSPALLPGSALTVTLLAPRRTITCGAGITRRCKDTTQDYYCCRFSGMAPEDLRFLFEFLYGAASLENGKWMVD
jgi:hypothetical protein